MKSNDIIIPTILEKYPRDKKSLIAILEDIQLKCGYLSLDALKMVSEKTDIPLVDIYGVATFYRAFSLKPRGKHLVSVCLGTACHVRGAPAVVEEMERELKIKAGDITADNEFTLETVNCVGACAIGPIVVVDGRYFSNVNGSKVKQILKEAREGLAKKVSAADQCIFPLEVRCPMCNHTLMDPNHQIDGHNAIRMTSSFGNKHGWLRLSSLYGSYSIESEYEIPWDIVIHFFCPHCNGEIIGAWNCADCGAPMIPMIVQHGAMIQICSRRGCKNHMLDLEVNIS